MGREMLVWTDLRFRFCAPQEEKQSLLLLPLTLLLSAVELIY
jgi:hypothetical protein